MEKLIQLSKKSAKKGFGKPKDYEEQPAQMVADLLVDPTRPRTMKQMLPNPNPEKIIPIVHERLPTAVIDLQERNLKEYREKKQKQWNFEQEIDKDLRAQQKESLNRILQQKNIQQQNDKLIEESLRSQHDALQERLRQRMERSFNKTVTKEEGAGVKPSSIVNMSTANTTIMTDPQLPEMGDGLTQEEISNNILKLLDKYPAPDRRAGQQ